MQKEIDVWVPVIVKGQFPVYQTTLEEAKEMYFKKGLGEHDFMKAKLIVEIPEPKKLLTPTMIRKAITKTFRDMKETCKGFYYMPNTQVDKVIKELFGEQ